MRRLLRTALAVLLVETALLASGVSNARQHQFREDFVQYSFRLVRAVKAIDGISLSEDGRHVRIIASPAWESLTEREQRNITRNVRLDLARVRRRFSLTGAVTSAVADKTGHVTAQPDGCGGSPLTSRCAIMPQS